MRVSVQRSARVGVPTLVLHRRRAVTPGDEHGGEGASAQHANAAPSHPRISATRAARSMEERSSLGVRGPATSSTTPGWLGKSLNLKGPPASCAELHTTRSPIAAQALAALTSPARIHGSSARRCHSPSHLSASSTSSRCVTASEPCAGVRAPRLGGPQSSGTQAHPSYRSRRRTALASANPYSSDADASSAAAHSRAASSSERLSTT